MTSLVVATTYPLNRSRAPQGTLPFLTHSMVFGRDCDWDVCFSDSER